MPVTQRLLQRLHALLRGRIIGDRITAPRPTEFRGARVVGVARHRAWSEEAKHCLNDRSRRAGRSLDPRPDALVSTFTGFSTAGSLPERASDKGKPGESR